MRVSVSADHETEALARLGAALHGSHRLLALGDKRARLLPWLREALEISPGIAATLLDLAEARCAPCPAVLTAAQRRNLASPYRLLLQHGWRFDHLDADVLEALFQALAEHDDPAEGAAAREQVLKSLLEHHGVGAEARDLSRAPYLWEPLERFFPEAMGHAERAFLRCPWPRASFVLIAGGENPIELELVARLPAIAGASDARRGEAALLLNGDLLTRLALAETWSRHAARVDAGQLRPGIHRLTLAWPALPAAGDAALADALRRLEHGRPADLHPVFGEVFSLTARSGDRERSCREPIFDPPGT